MHASGGAGRGPEINDLQAPGTLGLRGKAGSRNRCSVGAIAPSHLMNNPLG